MKPPLDRPWPLPRWAARGRLRWCWLGGRGLTWYKRAGARVETFTWLEEWYDHSFQPATIAKLADAGFNLVTLPAFSGFGRRTEAHWLARLPELVERCHEVGIRALAAVEMGGLCLETMPADAVPFESWLHRSPDGRIVRPRPEQYWRGLPDLTCEGYRDWLGGLLLELLQAGFDGVWLADTEPRYGYAPAAIAAWQEFIAEYTDFYGRKCGYPTYEHLAPPPVEAPGDPLWLDWIDFWQQRFQAALADYNDRIKSYDAERLTVISGAFQEAHPWEGYRGHVDGVHLQNPWSPGVESDEVVSQAAIYLISDAAELLAFGDGLRREGAGLCDLPTAEECELALAEGMFFGGQPAAAGWAGFPEGIDAASPLNGAFERAEPWQCAFERSDRLEVTRRFNQFCEGHVTLHESRRSAATIAILHSRDSLRFEREATILNLRAAQLACLRRHLPADVLVSDDLAKLEQYDVLIVPEQACLSQAALERVAGWVQAGGGLILVGEAAVRARRGRLRPPDWLGRMLGLGGSRWSLPNAEVVHAGAGRVLALPALGVEPFVYPVDAPDPSAGWEWLTDAVHDVSAWRLPVTLDGPETLFCRSYWLDNGDLAVMLLNYDPDHPADDVTLALDLDWPSGVPEVVLHRPGDEGDGVSLQPCRDGEGMIVRLPRITVYAVAEVRAEPRPARRIAAERVAEPAAEPGAN